MFMCYMYIELNVKCFLYFVICLKPFLLYIEFGYIVFTAVPKNTVPNSMYNKLAFKYL